MVRRGLFCPCVLGGILVKPGQNAYGPPHQRTDMRILWVTAVSALILTALAGCSGGDGGKPAPIEDDTDFQDLDLAATATTGIIRGLVVDEAIRPLGGAKIGLK